MYMAFFSSAITTLKTLVVAIGAGLGVWGVVNLLEGYGNDNPGAKSQGIKQLMAGAGIMLLGRDIEKVVGDFTTNILFDFSASDMKGTIAEQLNIQGKDM